MILATGHGGGWCAVHSRPRRPLVVAFTAFVLAGAWGCGPDAPVTPPPHPHPQPRDTTRPVVRIVFPAPESSAVFDRDANGLVDLSVVWSDSGGRANPASVRVTCAPDCLPGVAPDTNLALGWRVVGTDSASVTLEETLPLLMRAGARTLSVTVRDTAGNISVPVQVTLQLPPGAYQRSISLAGRPACQPERGVSLALSPDGSKGFAPFHQCVAVFDPEGVQPTRFIDPVPNVGWAAFIAVDTSTGLAYIGGGGTETGGFTILDTRSERVIGGRSVGLGLASVAVDGDRIYAGEACTDGRIFVYDKRTLVEVGQIAVGAVPWYSVCANSHSFQFSANHRTGWAAVVHDGLIRFDAERLVLLDHVPLDSTRLPWWGDARSIVLAGDSWLYLALISLGLDEWDARTLRRNVYAEYPPLYKVLALSPDGQTLAVSGGTGSTYPADTLRYAPRLYGVPGLTLRYAFPTRFGHLTDGVVWHPDGKRFYLMVEYQVEVYLVRPR